MSEQTYEIGSVIKGTVKAIKPYGAFVALDESTQGLVHISEITHGYVKDIHEHLSVGDEVTVKVLSVDEEKGKISLSIKATEEPPKKSEKATRKKKRVEPRKAAEKEESTGFNTLKEKLEEWVKQSADREKLLKK